MNCRQAEHDLFAGRDGSLAETRRAALAEHLATCAACRQLQENLAAAVESWRAGERAVAVPDAEVEWREVRRRLRRAAAPVRRPPLLWAVPLGAAAAVVLGLGLHHEFGAPGTTAARVAAAVPPAAAVNAFAPASSTVVYVDDQSGWTFVWGADPAGDRRI